MKRIATLLLVLFLLFTLAACGGDDEEPEAANTPAAPVQATAAAPATPAAQPPAATSAPAQPAAADAPAAPDLAGDAYSQLSSYRSNITWSVANGGNVIQQVTMAIAETADPSARQINMTSNDGDFAVIQIEDTLYVNMGGTWQQIPAAGAAAMMGQLVFTPEELMDMTTGNNTQFEFIGTEEVNGISTNHYRLTFDPNNLPEGMATGEVTDLNAEIWVANQADLPSFAVRMQVSYTGEYEGQANSAYNLLLEVSDVNGGLVIEAPN